MLSSKWYCSSSQKICPWWCCSYLCFLGQSCHWRTRHRNYPSKGAANTARIPYDVPFWLYQLSSDKSYTWNIHYQLKAKVEATKNYVRFISVNSVCVCVVTIFSLDDTSPDIWAAFKAYLHLQIRIGSESESVSESGNVNKTLSLVCMVTGWISDRMDDGPISPLFSRSPLTQC